MSLWDGLVQNVANTPPIQGLQGAFEQYGFNRQQGVPLMQGGTGNSVYQALTTGQVGPAQAYDTSGTGGGSGGGGAGGDDGWVDPGSNLDQSYFNNNTDPAELARMEASEREASLRGSISSQWDGVFNYLDNVSGGLRSQRDTLQDNVRGNYSNMVQNLGSERDAAQGRLEGYRGEARENQAQSLRSLAENFRNSLRAGQAFLGGMGAGDSSAVGRMTGALAKSANRTQGQVATQTNKIFNDINMREEEVIRTYETEKRNLDTWKNNKLGELSTWYIDAKNALDAQRATAQGEKAAALVQLDQQLYSEAINRLSQIESQTGQWSSAVDNWASQRMQQLDAAKAQITGQTQGVNTANLPGTFDRTMAMGPGNLGRGNAPIGLGANSEEDQLSRLA